MCWGDDISRKGLTGLYHMFSECYRVTEVTLSLQSRKSLCFHAYVIHRYFTMLHFTTGYVTAYPNYRVNYNTSLLVVTVPFLRVQKAGANTDFHALIFYFFGTKQNKGVRARTNKQKKPGQRWTPKVHLS